MTEQLLDRFALTGGVAVVTGAGRGIGEGIALGLAEAGCDVVLTARREAEIEAVAERVRERGRRALAIPGDITDGDFVDELADRSKAEMGKVTGDMVAEILGGTAVADIAVVVTGNQDLFLSLKAAKAMGVEVPADIKDSAKKVIE